MVHLVGNFQLYLFLRLLTFSLFFPFLITLDYLFLTLTNDPISESILDLQMF